MKSIFNILIVLSVVLSTTTGFAQIKNPTRETVKILGNCDTCKSAIENAGKLKNVASVTWNKDSKMAEISFDSEKTNRDEILKRIALAGYDNDEYLAPDAAYAQLAEYCKYERQQKQPIRAMDHTKMEKKKNKPMEEMTMPEMTETNPMEAVFNNYFAIKDALVKTNATIANGKSAEWLTILKNLKTEALTAEGQTAVTKVMPSLMEAAKSIAATKDIGKQRETFKVLSKYMHDIISVYDTNETLYYQYCPMQDANWLSKDKTVKNPYYGSQMLSCGSTVETIDTKN
ncbi:MULTISPECIES: DUF3347 domain-containing protein [Christiangramia]|jgi:copper chaperone CopZ|uniref:DUF3347 domain-containing protein n=2 Tax=Christiangramia TaxID=292691 RepID=A0A9X2KXN4_9FLAO|nr:MULTISPECIES: DUF3347 domain-containing protein [Christiangramia]APU69729.1 putative Co/Zn/Cd efflux system membrane fusion protein [Christiangramia flava JLT2011]MCP9200172.1 DUF3347 domain-containing protein [Gramella oceanisediminis]OSS39238.1 Co/Zn/Cd efflux system membrane fusion protein [Christiangramia flava JLT2011]|tara:strand:- start:514 stop:1374 length:861 start_codon:yes stop_codon:yes gene_type:complete